MASPSLCAPLILINNHCNRLEYALSNFAFITNQDRVEQVMRNGSGRQGHSSEGQRRAAEMYQHKDRPLGLSSPQSNSATTKAGYQQAGEQLCQTTGKLTYFMLEQDGGLTQP